MVVVAQLVRAPDCGSGGRRFETGLPPSQSFSEMRSFFVYATFLSYLHLSIESNQLKNEKINTSFRRSHFIE